MTPKFRTLAVLAMLAVLAGVVVVRCWRLRRPADNPKHPSLAGMCDFRDVVYYPTRAAFAGVNPYDARPPADGGEYLARYPAGNEFSPYAPLLFVLSAPFAALPLAPAEIAFCTLNLALLGSYAYALWRMPGYRATAIGALGLAVLLLLSRPGQSNYYYGQTTAVFVLATVGAWWLADSRPRFSAACLAIALIKPTFGGPLLVLMMLRGFLRPAFLGLAIAVVANGAVLLALLPRHFASADAMTRLIENQTATDEDPAVDPLQSASRIDLPFVVERLSGRPWPGLARYAATLAILGFAGWQLRRHSGSSRLLAAAFATLTITICIYHNIYDALLAAVAGAAAWQAASERTSPKDRRIAALALVLLAVPAVHYLSSKQFLALIARLSPALADFTRHDALWTLLCVLNGVCLGAGWCLILYLMRSEGQRGSAGASPSQTSLSRASPSQTSPSQASTSRA